MFHGDETVSRREFLTKSAKLCAAIAAGGIGLGTLAGCGKSGGEGAASAAGKELFIRGLGGAYQAAEEEAIFKPFEAATGIKVVPVPCTAAQVITMVESGKVQLDVLDLGARNMLQLADKYLERLDYDRFKLTNLSDIDKAVIMDKLIGNLYFSTVMVYSKNAFPSSHPQNWKDFWDTEKYPGPRTLADVKSGSAELEFALLADGMEMSENKLYPVDVDRAFRSLSKIKGSVVKWWDTGAVSSDLVNNGEAVLGGLWNGRVQDLIDKGAPLGIEWNQSKRQLQSLAIVKGAPHKDTALQYIDFALQPKIQAAFASLIAYGPTNKEAFKNISNDVADRLPSSPEHSKQSFMQDDQWWMENYKVISSRWNSWLLEG